MTFYRSELEVPVNKTNSQLRSVINSANDRPTVVNSTLDNWCEKVKFHLHNDRDSFNSIRDALLHDDSVAHTFPRLDNNDVNCFNSRDMFQQLQSKIAQGSDGNMHFTARFDVKDVNPDSIKVFVKEGSVVISVEQREMISPKLSTSREYTRKFNLPPRIIIDSITCTLSSDNILCLDGVLESVSSSNHGICLNTSTGSIRDSFGTLTQSTSSTFVPQSEGKYRININIGSGYNPQDISIKTRDDKLYVNARHEDKSETRTNYREFSKELTLPNKVDSLSLSAIYNNGILYIEAPYVENAFNHN